MADLPKVPFRYDDDPESSLNVPAARELNHVPAEVTVVEDSEGATFMDEDWADEDGMVRAWVSSDVVLHVEDYA